VSSPSSPPPESSPALPGQPTTGNGQKSEHLSKAVRSPPSSKSQLDGSRGETKINVPGRFVLGPRDDLDTLDDIEEGSPEPEVDAGRPRSRIVHRSIHICLADSQGEKSMKKLQAVIYVVGI
jgi:hypothetical protein